MSRYEPKQEYSADDLDNFTILDLLSDAKQAEEQALRGPFFPERGITSESLRRYAADCRERAEAIRAAMEARHD